MKEMVKKRLLEELAACLRQEAEVQKIVVFGSFLHHLQPHDMDVAIFQNSDQPYLPLAMKYRRLTRPIARQIPLDIIPLRVDGKPDGFLEEVYRGEVIYER